VTQCACTVYIASFGRKRLSPLLCVRVFYTGIFFKFTKNANVDYYGAKRSGMELAWLPDSVTFSFISLQKCMPFTIRVSGFQQQQKATLNTVENDTCAWFREIPFGPGRSSQCGVTRHVFCRRRRAGAATTTTRKQLDYTRRLSHCI